eukprot:6914670-Alexandrium_andersonii.AAC.1
MVGLVEVRAGGRIGLAVMPVLLHVRAAPPTPACLPPPPPTAVPPLLFLEALFPHGLINFNDVRLHPV